MTDIHSIMTKAPVIPVLVIDDVDDAIPVAEALVEGGLPCLEVTLRTPCALDVIEAMKTVPGAIVGAGTVLSTKDLEKVLRAGVEFVVSPGLTENLGRAAKDAGVPFLPGVATSAEIMEGLDMGLSHFKFFPDFMHLFNLLLSKHLHNLSLLLLHILFLFGGATREFP